MCVDGWRHRLFRCMQHVKQSPSCLSCCCSLGRLFFPPSVWSVVSPEHVESVHPRPSVRPETLLAKQRTLCPIGIDRRESAFSTLSRGRYRYATTRPALIVSAEGPCKT